MAKYRGEKKSGKMGDVIYSSWHGRPYVRRRPEKVANPQTADQQNHRSAFGEISRLSSAMKEGHAKGLHWHAVRQKKNTYCVFKSINKDCYGPDGIVYPHIRISSGTVPDVQITSAEIDEQGMVRVSFDGGRTLGHDKDEFYLFVFCSVLTCVRAILRTPLSAQQVWLTPRFPNNGWATRSTSMPSCETPKAARQRQFMFHVYNLMQQFFTLQVSFSEIIYTFAAIFHFAGEFFGNYLYLCTRF